MLNKIQSLTQVLVSVYLVRLLVTGASIGDALVIISLSGLYGLFLHLESKKEPEVNTEIKDKLIELDKIVQQNNTKISAMQLRR